MLTLTARTTVAELLLGPPALLDVLRSTGLYRDGDDPGVMLGQLCWARGFSPAILVMMLQSAHVPAERAAPDMTHCQQMPLPDLVTHIEQAHHAYLRRCLPHLTALAAADERLGEISAELQRLAGDLIAHLAHEEEALFPMIRSLAASNTVTATRCGSAVGGPIACMENDHESAGRALDQLHQLTDGYTAPAGARDLLAGLRELDGDLRLHMHKENAVLFPRALNLQKEAARSTLQPSRESPQVH